MWNVMYYFGCIIGGIVVGATITFLYITYAIDWNRKRH